MARGGTALRALAGAERPPSLGQPFSRPLRRVAAYRWGELERPARAPPRAVRVGPAHGG